MSTQSNKQIVQRFFELMSRFEVEAGFALLAPDATWWIPTDRPGGLTVTKAEMLGSVGAFTRAFAQAPVTAFGRMVAEGNLVCLEQTTRGGRTHGGTEYGNDYLLLVELRDGLITEVREYMNPVLAAGLMAEMAQAGGPAGGPAG
ncbi:MAG TPA: nuclear transport factor 2 family protein [Novosphingobium sp.]